jgi:hypothetical protein
MTYTVPGKLQKQGPIATLEGGIELGYHDKFMFNGKQFVQLVATVPGVLQASANNALALSDDTSVTAVVSYGGYRDSNGDFRFVNGSPTYEGSYTGIPTDTYNYLVVGYDSPVTTNTIKLWVEQYIPVEVLRVDYGYDGEHWYNVPTHAGNVTFEFDSSIKLYSTESSAVGQYVYTVDLGQSYVAPYWRVRSFFGAHSMSTVVNVKGGNITLSTVSGLPTRSDEWERGSLRLAYGTVTEYNAPGSLSYKYYKSTATNGITWSNVSHNTSTGVYTISGCVLDESKFSELSSPSVDGPVSFPGWVNNLSVSLREDYEVIKGYKSVLKEGISLTGGTTTCAALPSEYQFPYCSLYTYWYTNVNGCYYADYHGASTWIGDCYDSVPITQSYTDLHGSFSSDNAFYLSSFETPFDVATETPFTSSYLPGDIGPNGGVLYTESTLVSLSGTDPSPPGDPVTVAHAGSVVSYSSIAGSSIQSCSSNAWDATTDLYSSSQFIYTYPMEATQVSIQQKDKPMLNFWESDGSTAVVNELVDDLSIFDMSFDSSDSVYYTAIYASSTGLGSDIDDSFSGDAINQVKWDYTGSAITLDTLNSGILFRNTAIGTSVNGSLTNNYYYTGSFDAQLPVVVTTLSGYNYYGLSMVDYDNWNTAAFVGISGDWGETSTRKVSAATLGEYINVSDGSFTISDVGVDIRVLPDGENKHQFVYISGVWYYTREPMGSSCDVCAESVGVGPQLTVSGVALKVNSFTSIASYSSVSFVTKKSTNTGITTSGIDLTASFSSGTNEFVLGYNDGSDNTLVSGALDNLSSYYFSPRISGNTNNYANVFSNEYTSTGAFLRDSSTLSVISIDNYGNKIEVPGVSDANGVVIGNLDVLTEGFGFLEYRDKVSVATNQKTETQGGSIFVRVGNDIYKYNKTTLPLSYETGSNAAMYVAGAIKHENISNFEYDSFVNGGLHYITYDENRDIVVLRELSSATLLPVEYEVELDISSVDDPMSGDPVDLDTFYVVNNNNVYVMNVDPDSVAFCNVVAVDPIVPAQSGYQTSITAYVTNLYGDPIQGRLVTFSITSGGGAISPATDCTTSSGTAHTTFVADEVVGTSVITATASNTTC